MTENDPKAPAELPADFFDYDDGNGDCPNCGGEGYVSHCFEEFACIDPDGGCDLCMRRCDWCRPAKAKAKAKAKEAPSHD